MELEFLGTGEATDPKQGNTSILIHSESKLLIDCGFQTTQALIERGYDADFIDAIYFTHTHADHTFGLPGYLVYCVFKYSRSKPLTIIGQPGTEEFIRKISELGYSQILQSAQFELNFIETSDPVELNELSLSFARTNHPRSNYAVRVQNGELVIGVSGDGQMTDESRELFRDVSVLVHEAYFYDTDSPVHGTASEVLLYADSCKNLSKLAFVHIESRERLARENEFKRLGEGRSYEVLVPEKYDRLTCN